jgi:hypothetical protein
MPLANASAIKRSRFAVWFPGKNPTATAPTTGNHIKVLSILGFGSFRKVISRYLKFPG